jgi:hypothetical protein
LATGLFPRTKMHKFTVEYMLRGCKTRIEVSMIGL